MLFIYGDQSTSTAQTLSFNAAVTISKESSAGTLKSKVVKLKFGLVVKLHHRDTIELVSLRDLVQPLTHIKIFKLQMMVEG